MVRRSRGARLQRHRARDQRADRTGRARRAQRHRVGVRSSSASCAARSARSRGSAASGSRSAPSSTSSSAAPRTRSGSRSRSARSTRSNTARSRSRRRLRGAVLARQPARRVLPRDRRGRVGGVPAGTARAGARARSSARSRPIATVTLLFPTAGAEPYEPWALVWDLCLCLIVAVALRRYAAARWGAACFALVAIGSYRRADRTRRQRQPARPVRRGPVARVRAAAPAPARARGRRDPAAGLAVGAGGRRHRVRAHRPLDAQLPTTQPLLAYLGTSPARSGGSRSPRPTATGKRRTPRRTCCSARGWERQLDIAYNPIFYSDPLTAATYRTWLHANGVKFVALPDARLDDSSLGERALITGGLPYLHEVWHDAHWRVWSVDGFGGLVDGPATLQSMSPDRVTLAVIGPRRPRGARARDESLVGATRRMRGVHRRRLDRAARPAGRARSR